MVELGRKTALAAMSNDDDFLAFRSDAIEDASKNYVWEEESSSEDSLDFLKRCERIFGVSPQSNVRQCQEVAGSGDGSSSEELQSQIMK